MDWFTNLFSSDDSGGYDPYSDYYSGGDSGGFSFGDIFSSDSGGGYDPYSDYYGGDSGDSSWSFGDWFGGDDSSSYDMGPTYDEMGYSGGDSGNFWDSWFSNDSGGPTFGQEVTGPSYDELGYSTGGGSQPTGFSRGDLDSGGLFGPSPNGGNLDQMVSMDARGNPLDQYGNMLNGGGSSIMGQLFGGPNGGPRGGGQGGGGGMFGGGGSGGGSGGGMTDLLLALGLGGAAAAFLPRLLNSADGGSSGQPTITAPNYYAQFQNAGGVGALPNFNPGQNMGNAPGMQMATDPLGGGGGLPAAMPLPQGPVSPMGANTTAGTVRDMESNLNRTYFPGSQ
jgi:hypothetical protein